jgi:rare lipoprotein A (peptidoglycan hydrolase)
MTKPRRRAGSVLLALLISAAGCGDGAHGSRGAARPADAGADSGAGGGAEAVGTQARSKSKKPTRAKGAAKATAKPPTTGGKTGDTIEEKNRKADLDVTREVGAVQRGEAVWYGGELHGSPTSSGERFDKHKMTAAHRTLPLGTTVRVTNEKNGKSVTVRVNDRGPFGKRKYRIIDVSEAAAKVLDFIDAGFCPITLEVLTLPEPRKDKAR